GDSASAISMRGSTASGRAPDAPAPGPRRPRGPRRARRAIDPGLWWGAMGEGPPEAAPPAPRQSSDRPRILVVDDEASIRDLLAKTLALAEYDVDTAADATSALDRMRTGAYDLMIADLKMPGMDGLTLIRQAKRIKSDLPVIIITGFST